MKKLIKFNTGGRDPLVLFKVIQSGTFTVPSSKTVTSPVGDVNLGSVVDVGGGQLMVTYNDAASGIANVFEVPDNVADLYPGDIVACSAVVSNVITVSITSVGGNVRTLTITGVTTTGGVIGYYG